MWSHPPSTSHLLHDRLCRYLAQALWGVLKRGTTQFGEWVLPSIELPRENSITPDTWRGCEDLFHWGVWLCSAILRFKWGAPLPGCFMMRRTKRLRDYPQLPWVDQKICLHPVPTLLLRFNDDDETIYRCDVCGKLMTSVELASDPAR